MNFPSLALLSAAALLPLSLSASDVGKRFPSEKKSLTDKVTGVAITVLTSSPANDVRIYQTHQQWTADGKYIVFRSHDRAVDKNVQAFAVNETSGEIIQLTDGPGLNPKSLTLSHKANSLFYLRAAKGAPATTELVEMSLDPLLKDSEARTMKSDAAAYERLVTTFQEEIGGMALDADEKVIYLRMSRTRRGAPDTTEDRRDGTTPTAPKIDGQDPSGIRSVNLATGEIKTVIDTPFTVGHLQTNPKRSGELAYCHETGGDAPQRMWIVNADGSGNRPLYEESPAEWITHETFCGEDEVMFNIMGHKPSLRKRPTGIAVINVRTDEIRLLGQPLPNPPLEDSRGFAHCNGSPDGRWAVGDTFSGNAYLIDRRTNAITLLTTDHKMKPDHLHPAFSADSKRLLIQSGQLSDGKHLDLMIIAVPEPKQP